MRPFVDVMSDEERPFCAPVQAAPARGRIRILAVLLCLIFVVLAGRAVQLALAGDPEERAQSTASSTATARADIVDRNGELLATTVRTYALATRPDRVWNPEATANALMQVFPDLDRATLLRRLTDTSRRSIYLRRGLTPEDRATVLELGLAGLEFFPEERRYYPHGELAAHALGFTDPDLKALGGIELGLDAQIRDLGARGAPLRLSLDLRLQHIVYEELNAAARTHNASGGSAIMLDGRTGEVLALASWPNFDPNNAGAANQNELRDRVGGDVHELGSAIKPFTIAMALDEGAVTPSTRVNLSSPFDLPGPVLEDHENIPSPASLQDIIAHSSNIGAAHIALRVGADAQRRWLERLGLLSSSPLQSGRRQAPIAPAPQSPRDIAGLGFGYGLAATPAALAGAYTVFANEGARAPVTLIAREPDAEIRYENVFSRDTTARVIGYMRAAVVEGTGRAANVEGLEMIGKTGTAEKFTSDVGYEEGRNFSSFVGLFPGWAPRYVIAVSLDEPKSEDGAPRTGGAVSAPAVGEIALRSAPVLGIIARASR